QSPLSEVILAMNLIMQRVSGRALETQVIKMVPEYENVESPFTAFEYELVEIENRIRDSDLHFVNPEDLSFKQLNILHQQCVDFVDKAFSNSAKYGISMRVNQALLKIRQQLARVRTLYPMLAVKTDTDRRSHTIRLALELIRYNCYKNNIGQ